MFLTKKHIPRRTFLRGVGATLALPLLESMLPAQTPLAQTAANVATRFTAIWNPHGWSPTYWNGTMPGMEKSASGNDWTLGPIHAPWEKFKDKLVIVGGLDAKSSMPPPGQSGGDHSRASASYTGVAPKKTSGVDLYGGVSIDQMIANKIGRESLLPSLQLGIEDPGANTGVCGWGYHCAYTNSISWSAPNKPLPHEINPQVVFERLFGDGATAEQRLARKEQDRSILDAVTRKVSALRRNLPSNDKEQLDSYMDDIREIERRLQLAAKTSSDLPAPDVPFGIPESFDDHIKLLLDMQALAFQGDITRVSALMIARDISLKAYPESGINTVNHSSSHHGENVKRREEWARMCRYHQLQGVYFANKLQAIKEGHGTLLDHALIMWCSNMGNGNQHSHVNVGHLLCGGANGKLKGNRYISDFGSSSANLLLATLKIWDIELDSIGDSTDSVAL
jgi:hypothetical protein